MSSVGVYKNERTCYDYYPTESLNIILCNMSIFYTCLTVSGIFVKSEIALVGIIARFICLT